MPMRGTGQSFPKTFISYSSGMGVRVNPNSLYAVLDNLRKQSYSYFALLVYLGIGILFATACYSPARQTLLDVGISGSTTAVVLVLFLVCLLVCIALFWTWLRRLPKFKPNQVGIVLGIDSDSDATNEVLKKIGGRIKKLAGDYHLTDEVIIKTLPPNRNPKTDAEAIRCQERTNAALVVWGYTASGRIKGRDRIEFRTISFVFKHRPLTEEQIPSFSQDMSLCFLGKSWCIDEERELIDVNKISDNLLETSLYLLASSFLISKKFEQARVLYTALLEKFRSDDRTPVSPPLRTRVFPSYRSRVTLGEFPWSQVA